MAFVHSMKNGCAGDTAKKCVSIRTIYQKLRRDAGKEPNELSIPDSEFKIPFAYQGQEHKLSELSEIEALVDEFKKTAILELGLEISDEDMMYYKNTMRSSIYVCSFYVGAPITCESVKAFAYTILALYLFDDELDQLRSAEESLSYEDVKAFAKLISVALTGKPVYPKNVNFPRKVEILKFLKKSHSLACSSIPNYKKNCGRYLAALDEHLQAQAWTILESTGNTTTVDTYMFRRERTSGFYFAWEFCQLIHGIELDQEVRNSVVLGQIIRLGVVIVCLVNDLFSWEREMNGIGSQNYICVKLNSGQSMGKITKTMVEQINSDTNEMIRLCKLVKQEINDDPRMTEFIQLFQKSVDGNLLLHLHCTRYSYGFDFVVNK